MNKIVLKSALITVGALLAAGLLVFSLWILISPQSMATVSERLGNYNFAVVCADLKFKYSDETQDLARCADDSILTGKHELIIEYCEPLTQRSNFDEVCRDRDAQLAKTEFGAYASDYRTYILSNLSAAQYLSGDLEKAIKTAERGEVQCFARLVIEIVENGNEQDMEKVKTSLHRLDATEYVNGLIDLLTK